MSVLDNDGSYKRNKSCKIQQKYLISLGFLKKKKFFFKLNDIIVKLYHCHQVCGMITKSYFHDNSLKHIERTLSSYTSKYLSKFHVDEILSNLDLY